MKITIVKDKCRGHSNCASVAPNVFEIDDNFKAFVLDPQGDGDREIVEAAKVCPTQAIVLEDERTGKRIFPKQKPATF